MRLTWLHISDFHFTGETRYDRKKVLKTLVSAVECFAKRETFRPDLIFATGDIAHSGREAEYNQASEFFDALLSVTGLDKSRLFVVPGNHDLDHDRGHGLKRTLSNSTEAEKYLASGRVIDHITGKQHAFINWFDDYFTGIRTFPRDTTCGPMECVTIGKRVIAIVPLNSALFCQDKEDHGNLWLGRPAVDAVLEPLCEISADLRIALLHHPLEWLHDDERGPIKALLTKEVDVLLRGHLHEVDSEQTETFGGKIITLAAGAAYQTTKYPNIALYGVIDDRGLTVHPISYVDSPIPAWVPDNGVFATEDGYVKSFQLPKRNDARPHGGSPLQVVDKVKADKEALRRLKSMLANALCSSSSAMSLIERFCPPKVDSAAAADRVERQVDALMDVDFDSGREFLMQASKSLGELNDQFGIAAIKRVSRLLVPFLFVVGQRTDFGPWRQTSLGQVMGVPAGTRTFAEIVMAGLHYREVVWGKIEGERPFPGGDFGTSLEFQPEMGLSPSWDSALRDDLFRLVKPPSDVPNNLSENEKDQAINDGALYWLNEKRIRIYIILKQSDVLDDQEFFNKMLESVQKRYPLLAFLRLTDNLWTPHTRLFDQIREIMV